MKSTALISLFWVAVVLMIFAFSGCNTGADPAKLNAQCAGHGGVLSVDAHTDIIICGDHVARDKDGA